MDLLELKKALEKVTSDAEKIEMLGKISALTDRAESHIRLSGREISYNTREWSIDTVLQKFTEGMDTDENELFIPDYQREYKWSKKIFSRFIESILLDFPIPYLYISDVDEPDIPELDGRVEIIDGSQRIRALDYFVTKGEPLTDLKEITELEGFTFNDLTAARRRRFLRGTLRIVELKGNVDEDTRRDLFERINSGSKQLEPMEVRHGSTFAASRFYKEVISACADDELFNTLAPLSSKKRSSGDHRELVLRYFAYLNHINEYKGSVKPFLDDFLSEYSERKDTNEIEGLINEFNQTMKYISENIPMGFRKTPTSKTTTRARYEAISVGTALAIREGLNAEPKTPISTWITSDEFQKIVGADSANNISQLNARINYVKNKLLD